MVEHEYFCVRCQIRHFAEVWYFKHVGTRKEYLCLDRYLALPPNESGECRSLNDVPGGLGTSQSINARCPFCEAVHPIEADPAGQFTCTCGATALLCAPNTEPATSVFLAELGLSDTKADVVDETLSIVWGKELAWG